MDIKDFFVDETIVEFEIDGIKFSYKPVTTGEENEWMNEYMGIGEDSKPKVDFDKLNKCKMRNLVSSSFPTEWIKQKIGIEKTWETLNHEEKWKLLSKLIPKVFDKIMEKINSIDSPNTKVKKN